MPRPEGSQCMFEFQSTILSVSILVSVHNLSQSLNIFLLFVISICSSGSSLISVRALSFLGDANLLTTRFLRDFYDQIQYCNVISKGFLNA